MVALPKSTTFNTCLEPDTDPTTPEEQRAIETTTILELFWQPGEVRELRILDYQPDKNYKPITLAGYYDDPAALAQDAISHSSFASGVYYTLNPIHPNYLSVCKNRVEYSKTTVTDKDIVSRRLLLIDSDPVRRPAKISANDIERAAAQRTSEEILDQLTCLGWPEPIHLDSGNGRQLLYLIDLPTDDRHLIEYCLKALAYSFSDDVVTLDTSVFNPSRIARVPLSKNRKGEDNPRQGRPHRWGTLISAPAQLTVVDKDRIKYHYDRWLEIEANKGKANKPTRTSSTARNTSGPSAAARARAYVMADSYPVSIDGQGGHKRLFATAMTLTDGFGLAKDEALEIFQEYNRREGGDPESEEQLNHKLDDAIKKVEEAGGPSYSKLNQSKTTGDPRETADDADDDADDEINDEPNDSEGPVDNPRRLAALTLNKTFTINESRTIYYWCNTWWTWINTAYSITDPGIVEDAITKIAEVEFIRDHKHKLASYHAELAAQENAKNGGFKISNPFLTKPTLKPVTRALVGNIIGSLRAHTRLSDTITQPAWLGPDPAPLPPGTILPTRSALVHLETGATIPPTPRFFSPYSLDFDYNPEAPQPTEWQAFLDSIWGDDVEAISCLQEWFGYCLTPDTSQHKIMLLIGPTRSGKSTIMRTLESLIGPPNTVGPTLASLAGTFGLEPLLGKPLAMIDDARLSPRTDRSIITERLLSISGEGTLTCDRKNRSSMTGKLPTRIMMGTNETPWLVDSSQALANRFLVLHLKESFLNREDRSLRSKLGAELPSIFNWAIEGWRRLVRRGYFIQPASGIPLQAELKDLSSRVSTFLEEACELDPSYREAIQHVYQAWGLWCERVGETAGSLRGFSKELRTVLPKLDNTKSTRYGDKQYKVFTGLRLNSEYRELLGRICRDLLPQPPTTPPKPAPVAPPVDDEEVIAACMKQLEFPDEH